MCTEFKIVNSFLRSLIVMVFCVATQHLNAQILTEDFQDGDFTTNPAWAGDTDKFIVNASSELQLDDSAAGESYISTELNQTLSGTTEWQFYIKQSFSPSDNNKSRVYLMSSAEELIINGNGGASGADADGYFLQFGEGGSDDAIELFRNDGSGIGTGSIESLARGTDGFISSSFEITVKVVRTPLGEWELWADAAAGEDYALQATGSDNTYNSIEYIGWVCRYTSSNADNFFLDDIYIGEPVIDTEPPVLADLTVDSSTQLILEFNEPLNEASAETSSNYSVSNGIGNPTATELTTPNLVLLTFGTAFTSDEELTLTITDVTDAIGNAMPLTEEAFTYVEVAEPQPGDIIINEIFADPTPSVGLPEVEWIELYNTSANAYDLASLEYYNTTTLNALESYILPAGGHVIVSNEAGVSALQSFGETVSTSTFTALSNGGDSLTLVYNGTIIDLVVYEDDWYQDADKSDGGWSLERINPEAVCSGSQNWIASNSALGASLGAQNSVYDNTPDTQAPEIISAALVNETLIFLQAGEVLNEAINLADFSISDGYIISAVQLTSASNGILLTLEEPVEIGVPFTVTVSSLTDCEGNENNTASEWEIASGFPAEAGDVLITEIMADPSPQVGLPEVEYAELYNASDLFIDISDADFSGATFVGPVILAPGEYRVIMSQEDLEENLFFSGASGMESWGSTFLTNSGKDLILTTANGVIDEVTYDNTWYQDAEKDNGGWSLELINPNHPCSDKANWRASESALGGSPAEQNSVFSIAQDTEAPEIVLAYAFLSNSLFVEFNEPLNEASLALAEISLNGETPSSITAQDLRSIIINFQDGLEPEVEFTLIISGIEDCWGNAIVTQEVVVGLPETAEVGDLIINEVLSNPRGSGSDYVEIYNNSNKIISLQNWQLATRDDGLLDDAQIIVEFPRPLFPGGYALLTESTQNVADIYPNAVVANFIEMDVPSYSNDEGVVALVMPDGEVSDEFSYSSDYHFGLLDDTDGVSLERINFNVATENPDNWSSAAESENYGSPGYRNSQTQELEGSSGEISVFPEVFSPGGSGDVNNLEISYEFSESARSANVVIYSKEGVKMRQLKTNTLIGPSGTFFWDGEDQQGNPVSTGIYVIYFEVFTLGGDVDSYKVPATVAYR
ncbi:MAG: lamin tail domain-containing protein [Flavobacteriales bacterium]